MKNLLFLIYFISSFTQADTAKYHACVNLWEQLLVNHGSQIKESHIKKWESYSSGCSNTGIYEDRLASLYLSTGNMENAKRILQESIQNKLPTQYRFKTSLLNIEFSELLLSKEEDISKYRNIEESLIEISKSNPDYWLVFEYLANIQLFIRNGNEAVKNAKRAIQLNKRSWAGYRILVIHYSNIKQYSKARPLIVKAIKLNESLLSETEFMFASALTYISTGDVKTAEQLLVVLSQKVPEIKEDITFKKIVSYWRKKSNDISNN